MCCYLFSSFFKGYFEQKWDKIDWKWREEILVLMLSYMHNV